MAELKFATLPGWRIADRHGSLGHIDIQQAIYWNLTIMLFPRRRESMVGRFKKLQDTSKE